VTELVQAPLHLAGIVVLGGPRREIREGGRGQSPDVIVAIAGRAPSAVSAGLAPADFSTICRSSVALLCSFCLSPL
jgi:hypothetical protein